MMALGAATVLLATSTVNAVPTLQVGVPDGLGGYVPYQASLTDPTEDDTAETSGNTLALGAVYGPNTQNIGGAFSGGLDWSDFGFDGAFDGAGGVLFAVVPDGTLNAGTMTVNGLGPIYTTADFEDGFVMPNPPANHAPVQDGDYLFFDIGDFAELADAVPDFADSGSSPADGQVKTVTFAVTGYEWIHFDLFAIVTSQNGPNTRYDLQGNPGSHDVTFKLEDDDPDPPDNPDPPGAVPEPLTATLGLIALTALAAGSTRRRR